MSRPEGDNDQLSKGLQRSSQADARALELMAGLVGLAGRGAVDLLA